jgi:hypothetical protein
MLDTVTKRFTPSADELRLLTEHLCYELQMTFDLALRLVNQRRQPPPIHNAMTESFPMHVRQLTDFFWKERSSNPKQSATLSRPTTSMPASGRG